MKAWVLSEAKTGYTFNWSIYTGIEAGESDSLANCVVLNLVEKLHHQGRHLYFDNFTSTTFLIGYINQK